MQERWQRDSQSEIQETEKHAEKLRESRKEAIKDAAAWGGLGTAIAGGVAMSFGRGIVQDVGAGIFLTIVLAPGVLMAKDMVKGIADKWQGKDLERNREKPKPET